VSKKARELDSQLKEEISKLVLETRAKKAEEL